MQKNLLVLVVVVLTVAVAGWRWSAGNRGGDADVIRTGDGVSEVEGAAARLAEPEPVERTSERIPGGVEQAVADAADPEPHLVMAAEGLRMPDTPGHVKVRVRVVDAVGEPLVAQPVSVVMTLYSDGSGGCTTVEPMDFSQEPVTGSSSMALSDDTGTIVVSLDREMFPDPANALLVKGAEEGQKTWVEGVVLPKVGILDLGTIALLRPRERYPIALLRGTVLDQMGEPVAGVVGTVSDTRWVEMEGDGAVDVQRSWPVRTEGEIVIDADGSFEAFGPPGGETLDLEFMANGYGGESVWGIEPGADGVRVVMARTLYWSGTLVVPEGGPPVETYGVWLSEEGQGIGISPRPSGAFRAIGSTRSFELKVCYPVLGTVLYLRDYGVTATESGSVGVVDICALVQVIDAICAGEDGALWRDQEMQVGFVDGDGSDQVVSITTDGDGRLLAVLPVGATGVRVGRSGGDGVEVYLGAGQGSWTVR